jgi:hypothetical protein
MKRISDYTKGEGSSNVLVSGTCDECGKPDGIRYRGSDCLEGFLKLYHLVHTEVNHHFRCDHCGAKWTVFKML